jgi:hypothetical protein
MIIASVHTFFVTRSQVIYLNSCYGSGGIEVTFVYINREIILTLPQYCIWS